MRARQSVRRLVEATPSTYNDTALAEVVALGSYALPDIEQQLHGANVDERIYLLEAVGQIRDATAAPLLRFWAHRAEHERVRKKATAVLAELERQHSSDPADPG